MLFRSGQQTLSTVVIGGERYTWRFLLADVRYPILGIDFLRNFKLMVDTAADQILQRPARPVPATVAQVAQPAAPDQWSALLQQFPGVEQPFTVSSQPTHGVQHHLVTSGPPVTAKFRRLDPTRLAAAKAEFDDMLKAGVVRRSSSCWSSPLHMVRKKDGGWRPCGDFRRLNRITAEDK